jgi:hypothetical protein
MTYDESKHPRDPKGKETGGQWTKAGKAARKAAGLPAKLETLKTPKGITLPTRSEMQRQSAFVNVDKFVEYNKDWKVVYATMPTSKGSGRKHAFAMRGEIVWESITNQFTTKKSYFEKFSPTDIRIYTSKQAPKVESKHIIGGTWDKERYGE